MVSRCRPVFVIEQAMVLVYFGVRKEVHRMRDDVDRMAEVRRHCVDEVLRAAAVITREAKLLVPFSVTRREEHVVSPAGSIAHEPQHRPPTAAEKDLPRERRHLPCPCPRMHRREPITEI